MDNPIVFDVTTFRMQFPTFANATTYPDAMLEMYFSFATCYVNDNGNYGWLRCTCRALALNFMTAHLTALSILTAAGQVPGLVQNATIDKITVGLTPPPIPNQWQWWLGLTPYGQQLLALLQVKSAGGWFVGGLPETGAFRRVGGVFTDALFPVNDANGFNNGGCC